jgi:hypothetical protein
MTTVLIIAVAILFVWAIFSVWLLLAVMGGPGIGKFLAKFARKR